jgi:hypothetical protein
MAICRSIYKVVDHARFAHADGWFLTPKDDSAAA